jgi:hypothetical protein
MFTNNFEKTAFHLPGQQTLARVGGKIVRGIGSAVGGVHAGAGAKLESAGGSMLAHSAEIDKSKIAARMKSEMATKNKALKMQGKPELSINDKAIDRHAGQKAGKKLEGQLSGVAGTKDKPKQNFIQKHPYVSLAGGMYAAHKMSQGPSGDGIQRPELGY